MSAAVRQRYAEQEVIRWFVPDSSTVILETTVHLYPLDSRYAWSHSLGDVPLRCLFETEKEAITASRKIALAEEQRWRERVNALDARYDQIEDEETKGN